MSFDHWGTNNLQQVSIFMLYHPILLECIRISNLINSFVCFQILLKFKTLVFVAIIIVKNLNMGIVLSSNHFIKILE